MFLPCWLFAWGISALEFISCWVGSGLDAKMSNSRRSHEYSLITLPPMSLSLGWAVPATPNPTSLGHLQDQQIPLAQEHKSLVLLWVPVHTRPCVHPPRVESLFPPVLWSWTNQALLGFKIKYSGASSSWSDP